jgi:uncharacterized alpha/beta hydrolase family protein
MEKHTKLFVAITVSLAIVLFGLVIIGLNVVQQRPEQEPPAVTEPEAPCDPVTG